MVEDIMPGMAGNATAIGDAIGLAVRTLRERPEGSRVLILLTDGEDNASSIPPLEAAKLAKQYGIKIYTIGIGKKGAVPFPTARGYQMVTVSIDEELLKEIAEMTGGHYFSATDKNGLEAVYSQINSLEKTESNEALFFIREPFYRYPLSLSALLLLIFALWQFSYKWRAHES
jgi:Ca-activated chloride channel family protein